MRVFLNCNWIGKMFSPKLSKTQDFVLNNDIAETRASIVQDIRRLSEESLFRTNLENENSFRLGYLRVSFILT